MNNNGRLKHSVFVLLVTSIAVIYSVATIGCSMFIKGGFLGVDVLLPPSNIDSSQTSNNSSITDSSSNDSFIDSSNTSSEDASQTISSSTESSDTVSNNSSVNSSTVTSNPSSTPSSTPSNTPSVPNPTPTPPVQVKTNFSNALWISFYELDFQNLSKTQFQNKINTMFANAVKNKCDTVFVHVRPFADAFYRSSLFPMSKYVTGTQGVDPGYDPLEYMVTAAHNKGLQIHAWINPYRIAYSTDISLLSNNNKAKIWLSDPSTERNVLTSSGGLYFNPTKKEVRNLIVAGVKEILDNYAVDGIHMDDYFYPTTDSNFDKVEYDQYKAESPNNKLSQSDWRRANVSALVSEIYSTVKRYSGKVFGISPSYHISKDKTDNNYTSQYADLAMWMRTPGYIDYITPQLYFGYDYSKPNIRFDYLLNLWMSMQRHSGVKIYIGLAPYKMDPAEVSPNDGTEWQTKTDILSRQAIDSYKAGADGICLFSYASVMSDKEHNKTQINNLLTALDTIKKDD